MTYNYFEEMKDNINDVLNWSEYEPTDYDELYDDMWIDDYITGNERRIIAYFLSM